MSSDQRPKDSPKEKSEGRSPSKDITPVLRGWDYEPGTINVRKVSGMNKPSKVNETAFNRAIDEVSESIDKLLHSLETKAPPRNRDVEVAKLRAKSAARFARIARDYKQIA